MSYDNFWNDLILLNCSNNSDLTGEGSETFRFCPTHQYLGWFLTKKRYEFKEAMVLVVFCKKDGGVCSIAAGLCRWVGMNTEHLTFVAGPGGKIPNKNTNFIQREKN